MIHVKEIALAFLFISCIGWLTGLLSKSVALFGMSTYLILRIIYIAVTGVL